MTRPSDYLFPSMPACVQCGIQYASHQLFADGRCTQCVTGSSTDVPAPLRLNKDRETLDSIREIIMRHPRELDAFQVVQEIKKALGVTKI